MKTLDHTVHATSGSAAASTSETPAGTGISWPGRDGDVVGVPATGEQRAHLVADRPARSTSVAERGDRAAALEADDLRGARRAAGRSPAAAGCRRG